MIGQKIYVLGQNGHVHYKKKVNKFEPLEKLAFKIVFVWLILHRYDLKVEEGMEMTLEKLQLLATFLVDPTQKSKWLKWWNSK